MEKYNEEELTYVLFGAEAIQIYNISIDMLLKSEHLAYKVEGYNSVKAFVDDSKKWDGFIEIEENDYILLKKKLSEKSINDKGLKKNDKSSIFKFFK